MTPQQIAEDAARAEYVRLRDELDKLTDQIRNPFADRRGNVTALIARRAELRREVELALTDLEAAMSANRDEPPTPLPPVEPDYAPNGYDSKRDDALTERWTL